MGQGSIRSNEDATPRQARTHWRKGAGSGPSGAYGLKPAGHAMEHCSACNRDIDYHGKGRRYIIRACTHCGLRLDDKGV